MDVSQALKTLDLQSMDPEEQVVAAYYALASKSMNAKSEAKKALAVIANAKASQWLLFALDISEHLNDHNVSTLIAPPAIASRNLKDRSEGPPRPNRPISESIFSRVHPPHTPNSNDTPSAGGTPELLESGSGSEAGTESSEDLEDELFHLRHDAWRCNECNAELVDGECPDGHNLDNHCEEFWERSLEEYCRDCVALSCQECGYPGTRGVCLCCGYDGGDDDEDMSDATDENEVLFDEDDGVWRCVRCQWEVEWDNEGVGEDIDIGTCQCMIEEGHARQIDLSKYPDYEPAYCSLADSGHHPPLFIPQSSDSEGDSDDERFIDDGSELMDDMEFDHKHFFGYAGNNSSALETYVTTGASQKVDREAEEAASSSDESVTIFNARGTANGSDIELG